MQFRDMKVGEVFWRGTFYMRISSFQGCNAVCLKDGTLTMIDHNAEVSKVDINVAKLIEEAIGGD